MKKILSGLLDGGLSVDDTPLRQIVRGHFHCHDISRQNSDIMHSDLAGNVCRNRMALHILTEQLNLERRIRKGFNYLSLDLDDFLGHKKIDLRKRKR